MDLRDYLPGASTNMWMRVLTLCALATAASDVSSSASAKCSSECGLRPVTVGSRPAETTSLECAINATASESASAWTMQCYGLCPLASRDAQDALCRPLATRIKKVQIAVVEDSQQSGAEAEARPLLIEVIEHTSCGCSTSDLEPASGEPQASKRAAGRSGRFKRDSSHFTASGWTTASPSSSVSSPRSTSSASVLSNSMINYQTCLMCKEQQEICQTEGQIYDHDVCHCVYPSSRTFLNSFYTLGVVMLTVMVCCFLVFGVQKGDENVLNSSRGRSLRRGGGHGGRRASCSLRSRSLSCNMRDTAQSGSAVTAAHNSSGGSRERTALGTAQERTALTDDISAVP